jgi:hypothetical protein
MWPFKPDIANLEERHAYETICRHLLHRNAAVRQQASEVISRIESVDGCNRVINYFKAAIRTKRDLTALPWSVSANKSQRMIRSFFHDIVDDEAFCSRFPDTPLAKEILRCFFANRDERFLDLYLAFMKCAHPLKAQLASMILKDMASPSIVKELVSACVARRISPRDTAYLPSTIVAFAKKDLSLFLPVAQSGSQEERDFVIELLAERAFRMCLYPYQVQSGKVSSEVEQMILTETMASDYARRRIVTLHIDKVSGLLYYVTARGISFSPRFYANILKDLLDQDPLALKSVRYALENVWSITGVFATIANSIQLSDEDQRIIWRFLKRLPYDKNQYLIDIADICDIPESMSIIEDDGTIEMGQAMGQCDETFSFYSERCSEVGVAGTILAMINFWISGPASKRGLSNKNGRVVLRKGPYSEMVVIRTSEHTWKGAEWGGRVMEETTRLQYVGENMGRCQFRQLIK